jgi:ABC-type glutathione transport system ATPase component
VTQTARGSQTAEAAPETGATIRTEDLRKIYKTSRGDVPAVRGIDLDVAAGELFGLLGPNGAGKPNIGN